MGKRQLHAGCSGSSRSYKGRASDKMGNDNEKAEDILTGEEGTFIRQITGKGEPQRVLGRERHSSVRVSR